MNATLGIRTLVIGIGNADRGDDGVGLMVARRVKQMDLPGVDVFEEPGDGARLMELWRGAGNVVVIDAAHSQAEPGTIFRFDACSNPIPAESFNGSTHAFGLAQGIELSRVLNQLPSRLIVHGIAGRKFQIGSRLSGEVNAAISDATRRVIHDCGVR